MTFHCEDLNGWTKQSKIVVYNVLILICLISVSGTSNTPLSIERNQPIKQMYKVCKDQELKQSEPESSPQNKNGKCLKLQIVKIQREHMVNRMSSYFPKGGQSATRTELNNMNIRNVKRHRNSDTKNRQQRTPTKLPPWNGQ